MPASVTRTKHAPVCLRAPLRRCWRIPMPYFLCGSLSRDAYPSDDGERIAAPRRRREVLFASPWGWPCFECNRGVVGARCRASARIHLCLPRAVDRSEDESAELLCLHPRVFEKPSAILLNISGDWALSSRMALPAGSWCARVVGGVARSAWRVPTLQTKQMAMNETANTRSEAARSVWPRT